MSILQKLNTSYKFDTIPNDLRRLDQWLGFKLLPKDNSKFRKVPYNAHCEPPAVHETHKDALMPFDEAVRQYQAGLCDGIGFSLINTEYLVIDLDNQIEWINGHYQLSTYVTDFMNRFDSWCEFSVSGKGCHLWIKGKKAIEKTKYEWGELLGDNPKQGFIAMTGIMLPNSPTAICNRQEKINDYFMVKETQQEKKTMKINNAPKVETSSEIPRDERGIPTDDNDLIRTMLNNNEVSSLWNKVVDKGEDWSILDMKLWGKLAFYTGKDANRMFRLFKQSKLYREPNKTYPGHSTRDEKQYNKEIAKAIANCTMIYSYKGAVIPSNGENATDDTDIPTVETVKAIIENKQQFDDSGMPLLPESAQVDYELGLDVCLWLKDYYNFSKRWQPRAYDTFHTASGLWILSTVAAGRLQSETAKTTILNFMAVGKSGCRKTKTTEIAHQVLQKAGLNNLLHLGNYTPQLLTQKMSDGSEFSGQKGWYFDEFGSFINKILNESSAWHDYVELVRVIYSGVEVFNTGTIGRGEKSILNPYLSILGTITTDELMDKKLGNFWSNGLFARVMFFYAPVSYKPEKLRNPIEFMDIPTYLTNPLQEWNNRLSVGSIPGLVNVHKINITPEFDDAFYNYIDALEDMNNESINRDLQSSYQRFGEFAARIALLFASIDNAPTVELKHWCKAQQITELCRHALHQMYNDIAKNGKPKRVELEDKITKLLHDKQQALSLAEIKKWLNLKNDTTEFLLSTLETMKKAQLIETVETNRAVKYQIFYEDTIS